MAKIIVGLSDSAVREEVCAGLRLKRYDVSVHTPGEENEVSLPVGGDDVAILDYVVEDAASVKMLQASTDHADLPRFIFVLPDGAPVSHILMAVNEGASALVERPVNIVNPEKVSA